MKTIVQFAYSKQYEFQIRINEVMNPTFAYTTRLGKFVLHGKVH